MPVNWLKLMAFAFGAAVAALTGTLFAALNASVFPLTFSFPLLITVYTMVILGGQGSQAGVVLGAVVVERAARAAARPRQRAHPLLRRRRRSAIARRVRLLAQARGSCSAARVVVRLRRRTRSRARSTTRWVAGERRPSGFGGALVALGGRPDAPRAAGSAPVAYIGLIALVARADARCTAGCATCCSCRRSTSRRSSGRTSCSPQPDATRYIVLGVMLIALMIVRPNGLLGERRVEIV